MVELLFWLPPVNYCRVPKLIYFQIFSKAILLISVCATAIASPEVAHSKGCQQKIKQVPRSSEQASFRSLVLANLRITVLKPIINATDFDWLFFNPVKFGFFGEAHRYINSD